ncbi:MAG: hypothetical protein R6U98_27635, partial [Pirellulaceae bacterium]
SIPESLSREVLTAELGAPDQQEILDEIQAFAAEGRGRLRQPGLRWRGCRSLCREGLDLVEDLLLIGGAELRGQHLP